jgi:hypothetical protein
MLALVHLLLGAAIGKYFNNLWIVIPLAIASHYILDFIPHSQWGPVRNYKKGRFRGCDKKDLILKSVEPILGITLTIYLVLANSTIFWPMLLGAFFSAAPDILLYPGYMYNSKIAKAIHRGKNSKWHNHTIFIKGATTQIIVILASAVILI